FCYIIGNEIPASIVRWHGRRRVEKFIERSYRIAKEEDPDALVTYVNYPSTEYLRLPFLDFFCFNVYLESRDSFEDYLSRLHSLSEDRPAPLTEIGLASLRGGEAPQATLEALRDLDYPAFEVIVVNDGSTDETARIVSTYPYRDISEENQGLSRARNTGIAAATGEIVAFIDDDAYPDPHWLRFLALSFM